MSARFSVRSVLNIGFVGAATALFPGAAAADPYPDQIKPLAKCATKVPNRPTVNGVKVRPATLPVNSVFSFGTLQLNIASPTPNGESAHVLLGIYEWGVQRFGLLSVETVGCSANTVPMQAVMGLEKSGGPVEWKPNTLYTVYVLERWTPSGDRQPVYGNSWQETLRFYRETPLLKAPATAFWTKATKEIPAWAQ